MGKKEKILLIIGFTSLGAIILGGLLPFLFIVIDAFVIKKGDIGILTMISLGWGPIAGMVIGVVAGIIVALLVINRYKK